MLRFRRNSLLNVFNCTISNSENSVEACNTRFPPFCTVFGVYAPEAPSYIHVPFALLLLSFRPRLHK
jgi:hypothetical protein